MKAFNALVDYGIAAPDPGPPPVEINATGVAGPGPSAMGPHISALQGVPPLLGDHNLPLHVGMLGILALIVVVGLRMLGFRFSAVGKIGVGGG